MLTTIRPLRVVGIAMAALALMLLATPAFAQYPAPEPSVTVSSSEVEPGESVTFTFEGFAANSVVDLLIEINPVLFDDTVTADAEGTATVTLDLADDLEPGTITATATGENADGETLVQTATVEVEAAPAADEPLADTGADTATPLALGLGALVLGGGVLLLGRRRANDLENETVSS